MSVSQVNMQQQAPYRDAIAKAGLERAFALSQSEFKPFNGPLRVAPYNNLSPQDAARAGQKDISEAERLGRRTGIYQPFFNDAAQGYGQASNPFYKNYHNYLNPYMEAVLNRLRSEGERSFNEGIMPALASTFIQNGNYGGTLHANMAERAARDAHQRILDSQHQALASGYQQAGQMHAADQDRLLSASNNRAQLGQMSQAANIADVAALENQGERARNLNQENLDVGYRDYLRQTEHPWQQLSNLSGAMQGFPYSSQGMTYMQQPATPQLNRTGQMAQLAGQLSGLAQNFGGGRRFKEGGGLKMLSRIPTKKKGKE